MKGSVKVGRISGIEIDFHFTFILLILWLAAVQFLSGRSFVSAAESLLFIGLIFLSVLLHELGHALAARWYGIDTVDITLLPIGGLARLSRGPDKPAEELVVAIAGPLVNMVICSALFLGLSASLGFETAWGRLLLHQSVTARLLWANVWLAGFNLLPAFPMDGGRVLRGLLALKLSQEISTMVAARIGQGLAVLFILSGFLPLYGLSGNIFLMFMGLFVWFAAGSELSRIRQIEAVASAQSA